MGLDEVYSNIRSQILALEPLPSHDKIFNMVSQEESHKDIMIRRDDQNGTNAEFGVKHLNKGQAIIEKSGYKHCGGSSLDESKFYEIIDYPPCWGTWGRGRGRERVHGGKISYDGG